MGPLWNGAQAIPEVLGRLALSGMRTFPLPSTPAACLRPLLSHRKHALHLGPLCPFVVENARQVSYRRGRKSCAPRSSETPFKAEMIRRRVTMTTETTEQAGVGLGRGGRLSRQRKRDAGLRLL